MDDDRSKAARTLQRIAAALGTEVADFSAFGDRPENHRQALELLRLFASLSDPVDRQACLDYVRSTAARAVRSPSR